MITVKDIVMGGIKDKWFQRREFQTREVYSDILYYRILGLSHNGDFEIWDYNPDTKKGFFHNTALTKLNMSAFYDFELIENENLITELEAAYCKRLLEIA